MSKILRLLKAIGWPIVVFVLAAPILAAVATALLTPRIVTPNYTATATVPVSLVSGSHASYEASSYAADFEKAVGLPDAAKAAADASGRTGQAVEADLTSTHEGDTTYVTVNYLAPNEQAATPGVRAAVGAALHHLAQDRLHRAQMELDGAIQARDAILGDTTIPPPGVSSAQMKASRADTLQQASQDVATAQLAIATARVTDAKVDEVANGVQVTTAQQSTRSDQLRMIATAGLSALFLAVGAVALLTWLRARRRDGTDDPEPTP